MVATCTAHSSHRPRRLWLTLAALVVGGLHLILPLLCGLLGIGLILTALLERHVRRITRILLALAVLTILAMPWLCRYQPAVVAAPGQEMRWLTQPNLLGSVVKRGQAFWEIRTCDYIVQGWSSDGVLYYEEACKDRAPQVWAYNPDLDSHPRQVDAAPIDLMQKTVPRSWILERVWSPGVHPSDAEPGVRAIKVREHGVASPDGRWVAVVVRWVYGPEDVIVLASLPRS
ncbi:MAG: hypothetical protein WBH57_09440 [Anaerolineae bacterium]